MGEDVLVQAGDEVELCGAEREARFLQLDGDGYLTRASVHREMWDLDRRTASVNIRRSENMFLWSERTTGSLDQVTYSRYGFGSQDAEAPGGVLRWVELPSAEVEFIRERGGEDHPNHI